eukprot:COSAG04_NODE_805_length_10154_cov_9.105122_5_plen_87_part_00
MQRGRGGGEGACREDIERGEVRLARQRAAAGRVVVVAVDDEERQPDVELPQEFGKHARREQRCIAQNRANSGKAAGKMARFTFGSS